LRQEIQNDNEVDFVERIRPLPLPFKRHEAANCGTSSGIHSREDGLLGRLLWPTIEDLDFRPLA
jgi:hypothetical protein